MEASSFAAIAVSTSVDTAAKVIPSGLLLWWLEGRCRLAADSSLFGAAVVVVVDEAESGALVGVTAGARVVVVVPEPDAWPVLAVVVVDPEAGAVEVVGWPGLAVVAVVGVPVELGCVGAVVAAVDAVAPPTTWTTAFMPSAGPPG